MRQKGKTSPGGHFQGVQEDFNVLILALQGKGQADGPLAEGVSGRAGESKGRVQAPERWTLISGSAQDKTDPVCIESDPDGQHEGCCVLPDGAEKRADSAAFQGRPGQVFKQEFPESPSSAGFLRKILRVQLCPRNRRGAAGDGGKGGFQICFRFFQPGNSFFKVPLLKALKSLLPFFRDSRISQSQVGLHRKPGNEGSAIRDLEEFSKTEKCKIPIKPNVPAQRGTCAIFDQERPVFRGPRPEPAKSPLIRESEVMDDQQKIAPGRAGTRKNRFEVRRVFIEPQADSAFPENRGNGWTGICREPCRSRKSVSGQVPKGKNQRGSPAVCRDDGPADSLVFAEKRVDSLFPEIEFERSVAHGDIISLKGPLDERGRSPGWKSPLTGLLHITTDGLAGSCQRGWTGWPR